MTGDVELDIESIAAGGDGIARHDGMVVFVPRTAPGDRVRVSYRTKGRFARGILREVLSSAPSRVTPRCQHYVIDRCGGCQLQHISYADQLQTKARIVSDAISRIGHREAPVISVAPSPREFEYRRRLTVTLERVEGRWVGGLHLLGRADRIFQLEHCAVATPRVRDGFSALMTASGHLPATQRIRASILELDNCLYITIEGGVRFHEHAAFFAAAECFEAMWWIDEKGIRRQLASRNGAATPGASFAQINEEMASQLQQHLVDLITARKPSSVIDAYCGSGSLARRLDGAGMRVAAIEQDGDAVAFLAPHLSNGSAVIQGTVEDQLASVLPADLVILNPPRSGLDAQVPMILEASNPAPGTVLYISCDAATLARDLARMPSYRIHSIKAFDMFPQTAHVETVCELRRN